MKIYVAAFLTSLVIGLAAAFMISGSVGPELDKLAGTLIKHPGKTDEDPQEPVLEPAVLLTFANGDVLAEDLTYTSYALGMKSRTIKAVERFVNKVLKGIDPGKPSAAAVFFREGTTKPTLLFCLPVKQQDEFESILNKIGNVYVKNSEKKIAIKGLGILRIEQRGDYAFISGNKSIFNRLSDDDSLFGSFAAKFDVGLRITPDLIPEELKDRFFASLEESVHRNRGKSDSGIEAAQESLEKIDSLIHHTKQFTVGIDIDCENNRFAVETELIADEDSILASEANSNLDLKPTQFAGFDLDDAGFNLNCCSNWSEDKRDFQKTVAEKINSLEFETFGQQPNWDESNYWLTELVAACGESLDSNRIDFGATSIINDGRVSTALGVGIENPARLETFVKTVFEECQKRKSKFICRPRFATHRDIVFHQIERKLSGNESSDTVYGKSMKITIGFNKSAAYIGIGERAFELLKSCIDASANAKSTSHALMSGDFEFSPWLSLVADDTPDLRYVRSLIKNSAAIDRLSFESHAVENGYTSQIEIEMGFARIAWKSIKRAIDRKIYDFGGYRPVKVISGEGGQMPFSSMIRADGN